MGTPSCTRTCWIAGAGLGLLVWLFTSGIGSLGWFAGLFLGLIAAGLLAAFLIWLICEGEPAMDGTAWQPQVVAPMPRPDRAPPAPAAFSTGVVAPPAAPPVTPSGDAQEPVGTEERPGIARNDIYGRPAAEGAVDDLKDIKGIGPKLEELLHQHGVTRFDQIAAWDEADKDRFAEVIGRMGGRIRSDDWVGQARALAEGGVR